VVGFIELLNIRDYTLQITIVRSSLLCFSLFPCPCPHRLAIVSYHPPILLSLQDSPIIRVRVTLRLTGSQSVCLGVEPTLWTFDQILLRFQCLGLKFVVSSLWGTLSDERRFDKNGNFEYGTYHEVLDESLKTRPHLYVSLVAVY
jgi:hypothetical protein